MSAASLPTRSALAFRSSTTNRPKILTLPLLWLRRIGARRVLAGLHPEQIREAGLDPHAVRAESLKPFWRA